MTSSTNHEDADRVLRFAQALEPREPLSPEMQQRLVVIESMRRSARALVAAEDRFEKLERAVQCAIAFGWAADDALKSAAVMMDDVIKASESGRPIRVNQATIDRWTAGGDRVLPEMRLFTAALVAAGFPVPRRGGP